MSLFQIVIILIAKDEILFHLNEQAEYSSC